jgi:hypothetical protein
MNVSNIKTYGIIFYEFGKDKLNLYLRQNTKDYYEDFIINDTELIESLINISILYKAYNPEKNHTIFLLNKNIFTNIFDKYKIYKKISLKTFQSIPIDKTLKHNRLKFYDLNKSLKLIQNNYIYRKFIF